MISFYVDGMMCVHCKARVRKALENVDGVTAVEVNLDTKLVTVEGTAAPEILKDAVVKAGYTVLEK